MMKKLWSTALVHVVASTWLALHGEVVVSVEVPTDLLRADVDRSISTA